MQFFFYKKKKKSVESDVKRKYFITFTLIEQITIDSKPKNCQILDGNNVASARHCFFNPQKCERSDNLNNIQMMKIKNTKPNILHLFHLPDKLAMNATQ